MVEYQTFRCLWTSSSTGWRLDTYPLMPGIICPASACCFPLCLPVSGSVRGSWAEGCWGKPPPFYIVLLADVYLYFSLSAMVDIKGKRRILKTNLIDYLENHLSGRISVTEQDYERLYGPGSLGEEIATGGKAGRRQRTSGRRTVELMPIRSRAVQPEETSDRLDREVFSTENATPEKAEGKAITERPEDPARVTEEELQALLQELLTV